MIARYTGQPLAEGMLVCRRSVMTNGFAARPVLIVKVSGSRATVRDKDGAEARIGLSTIAFIVDTMEEGMEMSKASADFLTSEHQIAQLQAAARAKRMQAAIAKAIGEPA